MFLKSHEFVRYITPLKLKHMMLIPTDLHSSIGHIVLLAQVIESIILKSLQEKFLN